MKKRIVIITDCSDIAYNELRGVILKSLIESGCANDVDIEPVVSVKPFSIINGNFILRLMAEAYPPETFFLIILNPVKKRPERIFGRTHKNNFIFMGANTGVFSWLIRDFGLENLYELRDPGFLSFGGKYVHAPNIARIISGVSFEEIAIPFDEKKLVEFELENGTIVHIDNFGLVKFIGEIRDAKEGDKFKIKTGKNELIAIYGNRMMSHETNDWIIYPGSSLGLPELGKVRKNGAKELNLDIGDKIFLKKI